MVGGRTLVDAIAQVAAPLLVVDERHERINVRAARATAHNHRALDDGQILRIFAWLVPADNRAQLNGQAVTHRQIPERMDHNAERQTRLLQQTVALGDLVYRTPDHTANKDDDQIYKYGLPSIDLQTTLLLSFLYLSK